VICPADVVTGGPEAQHQLVDMANDISPGSAAICYTPLDEPHETAEPYRRYDTPSIRWPDIPADALVILPEIWPQAIEMFTQPCGFWWLSWDNFWDWGTDPEEVKAEGMRKAAVQLTQSDYARRRVLEKFGLESMMLTDYINTSFTTAAAGGVKRPRVAVNPAKGEHLIEVFKEWFPDIELIELADMSREQVAAELAASSVYIDFGHHPGRDRMPREAALSNVVVMATKIGAAANAVDLPISEWYKVTTMEEVGEKVRDVLANFDRHLAAQRPYAEIVRRQRSIFRTEVERLLDFTTRLSGPD